MTNIVYTINIYIPNNIVNIINLQVQKVSANLSKCNYYLSFFPLEPDCLG